MCDATTVGAFKWTVPGDTGFTFAVNQTLYTFCIQQSQTIQSGTGYTVSTLTGAPSGGSDAGAIDAIAAAQIQGLITKYSSALDFTGSNPTNYTFNSVSYTDAQVAAAMQLAVWEVEYDGGLGGEGYGSATNYFTSGNVRASGQTSSGTAAITLATGWLNGFTNDSAPMSIALTNQYKQDQLIGIPTPSSGGPAPVPLPAALPAGLAMMGGMVVIRRLRRKG
jgi:hypothetical protein